MYDGVKWQHQNEADKEVRHKSNLKMKECSRKKTNKTKANIILKKKVSQ